MAGSFNSLPVEIVMEIARHVDHPDRPDRQSALAALNRTSKLLNSITTWRLYRAPRYRYSNWPLFARTIITRKDLAALVKDLYFRGPVWYDPMVPDKFPEEVAAHYSTHNAISGPCWSLTVGDSDDDECTLFEAEEDGETNAYIEMAVILHFCSESVETIFVNLQLCYEGFETLGPPWSLPALKHLSFGYVGAVEGFEVLNDRAVTGMLIDAASSNLKRLELSRVIFRLERSYLLEELTHLVMKSSALSPEDLDRLLWYVPNLEKFEFQGGPVTEDESDVFDLNEAFDVIVMNCKRLKWFVMDASLNDSAIFHLTEGQIEEVKRKFASSGIEFTLIE